VRSLLTNADGTIHDNDEMTHVIAVLLNDFREPRLFREDIRFIHPEEDDTCMCLPLTED